VKNPEEFGRYKKYPNVSFYSYEWSQSGNERERDCYYDMLCHAKYIFFTDAYGFARNCRKDQIRVQLWHGCGFKTRVNFASCENRYEYNIVISSLYKKIHEDIYGLRADQVLVTGYPKEDWLFHPADKACFSELNIPPAGKYIFWLPTFRSTESKLEMLNQYTIDTQVGLPVIDTQDRLGELNGLLVQNDIVLVIKLHPFQKRETVHLGNYSNIVLVENRQLADKDIQLNRLLGHADALISDYSSAAVDYLILDRPIAFTLDDVNEYENTRGFVFENITEWLPGKEIYNRDDYMSYVREIAEGIDSSSEKRRKIREKMHAFSDDGSSRRVLEKLHII
jgi:CDP-glycerol glycerophosphotransferase (TagB/SpsB family)